MKDYLFPPMNGVSRLFKLTEHASFSVDMLGGIVVLDGYALTLAPLPGYGFFIICGPGTLAGVVELGLTGTQSVQVTIENGVFRFADQPDIDLAALSAALDAATQRANHTGTQPIASVDGLAEALAAAAASGSTVPVIIRTAITGPPLDPSPGVKQSRVIDLTGGTASSVGPVNWYVYSSLGAGSWGGTITVIEGDTDAQAADKVVASMAADAALMVHYSAARVGLTVVVEARVAAAHDEGFGWELEGGYPADAPLASGVAPVAGTTPLSIGQLCRVGPYELTGGRTQAYDWFIAETMTGWRQIDELSSASTAEITEGTPVNSTGVTITGTLTDGMDPVVFPDLIRVPGSFPLEYTATGLPFINTGTEYRLLFTDPGWTLEQRIDEVSTAAWLAPSGDWPELATFAPSGAATGIPSAVRTGATPGSVKTMMIDADFLYGVSSVHAETPVWKKIALLPL